MPPGNLSVFPMSEDGGESLVKDGGDSLVKEPEICSGSLNVVVDASELIRADPGASNLGLGLSQLDCAASEVNLGSELEAGNFLPDAGVIVAASEPSVSVEEYSEDEESQKFGDSSCAGSVGIVFEALWSQSVPPRHSVYTWKTLVHVVMGGGVALGVRHWRTVADCSGLVCGAEAG